MLPLNFKQFSIEIGILSFLESANWISSFLIVVNSISIRIRSVFRWKSIIKMSHSYWTSKYFPQKQFFLNLKIHFFRISTSSASLIKTGRYEKKLAKYTETIKKSSHHRRLVKKNIWIFCLLPPQNLKNECGMVENLRSF